MATFGQRFKKLRNNSGLTQEKLAEKFYLNKSSISRYEQDKQLPEIELLEKFADFFNVSIDYLLGRTAQVEMISPAHASDDLFEYLDEKQKKELLELGIEGILFKRDIKDREKIKKVLLKAIKIVKLANGDYDE